MSISGEQEKERIEELPRTHANLKADMSTKLSDVNKVVKLHKEASDEWSRKAGELKGVIKALEIHLSQVENYYKERLEKEESSRKQLRKDLETSRKASVLNLLPLSSVKSDRSSIVLKLQDSFQIYYQNYLDSLLRQMKSFFESTHPGQNLNSLLNEVAESFESHWLKGTVNGCENLSRQNACVHHLWAKEYDLENPAVTLDALLQVGRPRLVAAVDRTKRYVMEQMKNAKEQMQELQKACIEWDPDTEEFEDADGEVYDKTTYMELGLQGLL
ncbi:hypothetical protein LWI29_003434 [Acer saccharum]|uniref:Uncharacterized protein n=1 Tax=Acer saccharum TaxID=4024 RepID=A0AA39VQQ5_ACESA|nr:hypothetical protein LWI29_003434 [Acer saccharum]